MIAKIGGRRGDGKTSFRSLCSYINSLRSGPDPETGEIITGAVSVQTNCLSVRTAWIEMWGASVHSTRTKDPVMHLVLSWASHENPTDKQAFDAGQFALNAIGLEEHQYLSAVHRDTDNVHLHVMVNKVHPERRKVPRMSYTKFALDKAMRQIEIDQGWSHTNGPFAVKEVEGKKTIDWAHASRAERLKAREGKRADLPEKARQFEIHTGNESLSAYARGKPKKDASNLLRSDKASWQGLHSVLAANGLELRPANDRNNAFYVASMLDPTQAPIKASAIGLGGGKLIKLLGAFSPVGIEKVYPVPEYRHTYSKYRSLRDPENRANSRDLRAKEREILRGKYDVFIAQWKIAKAPVKLELSLNQKARRKALTSTHKTDRDAIRSNGLDSKQRKALLSVLAFEVALRRKELNETFKAENSSLRREKSPSYREWVADLAEFGNPAAIAQLRGFAYADKRKGKQLQQPEMTNAQQPYFMSASDSDIQVTQPVGLSDRVTWTIDRSTGAVNYSVNNLVAFRDEGQRITFNNASHSDADSIEVGLLLAKEKFGAVVVHGDQEFSDRVLAVAAERRLDVRFADPELEQRRKDAIKADIDQKRQRVVEDQKQVDVLWTQAEAKIATQQPEMMREAAKQVLSAREPVRPVRDYVEMEAIDADIIRYRSKLDYTFRESLGERPDPEKAGGFIGRHMAKGKAMQWDEDFDKNVTRPLAVRREHLNSNHPDAVKFRDDAWNRAIIEHDSSVIDWTEMRDYARQTLMDFHLDSEPPPSQHDQRAARQAEAQRLQQRQEEQEQERQNLLDRDTPDLDI
ncbi:relaxase [Pseudomonas frederiksbergensis]|uniref:TraI/MobA(P) family conjugative relaxase n=1 Tax=Pseudomonas frederiksbergensis TaxID=104087 RepID=UPI0009583857|nr:TraI/MobA(P) family conjugative relaxase [Pseudomonas frederiksbergensis]APV40800.1 relaxase [Pseudomonas frederiksbergensis]